MDGIVIQSGERILADTFGWSKLERIDVAILSDIHIPQIHQSAEGIKIRENFSKVLSQVVQRHPQAIIISGDLGQHEGNIDAYRWIKKQLLDSKIPYLIIPGNHDDGVLISEAFPSFTLHEQKLYYQVRFGSWLFLFLDSSPDSVSATQLTWLDETIKKQSKDALIALVMHHPPTHCGCLFMDTHYPLRNNEPLMKIITDSEQVKHIFCGHYHTNKELVLNNRTQLHLTPSTWFQIDDIHPFFKISDYQIGYRWLSIVGSKLETNVHTMSPYQD